MPRAAAAPPGKTASCGPSRHAIVVPLYCVDRTGNAMARAQRSAPELPAGVTRRWQKHHDGQRWDVPDTPVPCFNDQVLKRDRDRELVLRVSSLRNVPSL